VRQKTAICIVFSVSASNPSLDPPATKKAAGASLPRYEQVKRQLRQEIESGVLAPGQLLPSQAELTAKYGVSDITIRRALQDLASNGILQRVTGVGTFVREVKIAPRVTLMLLGFDDLERWSPRSKIFGALMAGAGEIAWESWSMFSIVRMRDTDAARAFVADQIKQGRADGFLIKSRDGEALRDLLPSIPVPYVTVRTAPGSGDTPCVVGDEFGEAQQLTQHLIERGYKRIGFIGPPVEYLFQRRFGGYSASIRGAGLPVDDKLVVRAHDYDIQNAGRWVDALFAGGAKPDAIFCGMGTLVARRMIAELESRGIQVPRDVGFVMHDPDDSGELFDPPVTSAGCSNFELGRAAANLLNMMLMRAPSVTTRLVLPPHMVIRSSTPGPGRGGASAEPSESAEPADARPRRRRQPAAVANT